ncbi:MAG: methyltransferase [Verrucomicrobiota bacterium]
MPKDWNDAYLNENTPWDKGYAAPPLAAYLETRSIAGRVLVPGCGTGHDVRLLTVHGAEVTGLDIAQSALTKAETFPLMGNERYEMGDFLDLDPKYLGQFDYVFEHTCLCAIDPELRAAYAEAVPKALAPGGRFLAIFFRKVRDYDGEGPPFPISEDEIETLFGENFDRVESHVPEQTYPSRPVGCEEVVLWQLKS